LIKQGAKLVEHAQDILEELHWAAPLQGEEPFPEPQEPAIKPDFSPKEKEIWDLLEGEPRHVDQIVRRSEMGISGLLSLLLGMELKGLIKQLPGKYFARR
jgi:DNA processing protein